MRPFGVVVAHLDPMPRGFGQHRVVQQHQVHVQQCRQLMRRLGRQIVLEGGDLLHHGVTRVAQARHFGGSMHRIDEVVRHIHPAGCHQHGAADGDPARDRLAEHLDAHACTV
jgi:hypothetical protein